MEKGDSSPCPPLLPPTKKPRTTITTTTTTSTTSSPPPTPTTPTRGAMQTRRGLCYEPIIHLRIRKRKRPPHKQLHRHQTRKKTKKQFTNHDEPLCRSDTTFDLFDELPDDIVVCIFSKVAESTSHPLDLLTLSATCKRLRLLAANPMVLRRASAKLLALAASVRNWSESTHRFLKSCADAGNLEACYILGMIRFYCMRNRNGASLMARAAMGSHAAALYSLAVIQFNGSGGSKGDKDLIAGVALCARAAFLGHVEAMRELGHCLQDGYGVRRNVTEGRRFLVQATARELAAAGAGCSIARNYGSAAMTPKVHVANRFLMEWFGWRKPEEGFRMCSHEWCGRPETRRHEFRRCSVCGAVNYCSRACQAVDWKLRHKAECVPVVHHFRVVDAGAYVEQEFDDGGDGVAMEIDAT